MLPYTSKFYANGTIFDSVGDKNEKYISSYVDSDVIYFLKNQEGLVEKYNTKTEAIEMMYAKKAADVDAINSIVVKNNTIYGFIGYDAKLFDDEAVLYVDQSNSILVKEDFKFTNRVNLLSSATQIRDFLVMPDGSYIIAHGINKLSKYNHARILQYTLQLDASATELSSIMASTAEPQVISVDYVREYTNDGLMEYPIVLGRINTSQMFLAKVDESTVSVVSAKMLGMSGSYVPLSAENHVNYNLTNFDYIAKKYAKDVKRLSFKLTLKNVYNNRDTYDVSIPVDVSFFTSGYHHFAFRLDTAHGLVSLFVDGRVHDQVTIPRSNYTFQDITYESMCVGATYFANNVPLFKKLKQPNYYMVDNCKLTQFKIYDKAISDQEIKLLAYNHAKIDDMIASFPCGQRNEIEQIERLFSFNVPGNRSNSINVVIKNSEIFDESLQTRVKSAILDKLKKTLPATTRINQIIFKNSNTSFNVRS